QREDRADRDDRVRRGDDDDLRRGHRVAGLVRHVGLLDADVPDVADLGLLVAGHEVVLEIDPALVYLDLRANVVVRHRQDRRADAERALQRATDVAQPFAVPDPRGPRDVRRQVTVAQPEPRLLAVAL